MTRPDGAKALYLSTKLTVFPEHRPSRHPSFPSFRPGLDAEGARRLGRDREWWAPWITPEPLGDHRQALPTNQFSEHRPRRTNRSATHEDIEGDVMATQRIEKDRRHLAEGRAGLLSGTRRSKRPISAGDEFVKERLPMPANREAPGPTFRDPLPAPGSALL